MFKLLVRMVHCAGARSTPQVRPGAWLTLAACVVTVRLAVAQPAPPLRLDEVLRQAQQASLLLPAQDAGARAARELAIAAGQLPDPVLKLGITNLPVDGAARYSLTRDFMTMRAIGVSQEFTRGDKRAARAALLERDADIAGARSLQALTTLRQEAAIAWLDRYHWERIRELQQTQRAETALQIDAADAAYRGAGGSQADVFAARAAVAQIDEALLQTQREIDTATTRLARWIGTGDAGRPLAPAPDLAMVRWAPDQLEQALQRHPQVVLKQRQQAAALAQTEVARSNLRSDWSAELMFNQRGPAYSNMVSLNFSLPLQWDRSQRQDRELAASLSLVEQLRLERDEEVREQVAQARTLLQTWQANRQRLALFDHSLIPLAGERSRAALASYRGGAGTLTSVLEARRGEIDTRLNKLQLEMTNAGIWARLEYLTPTEQDLAALAGETKP